MELKNDDKVKILPWSKLVEKYGKKGDCIDCAVYFSANMHTDIDGKELVVTEVDNDDDTILVKFDENDTLWVPVGAVTKIYDAPQFKIGDKVRLRSWEDLEEEYGLDDDGDIDTPSYFLSSAAYENCKEHTLTVVNVDTDETVKVEGKDGCIYWIPCYVLVKAEVGTANTQEHYKKAAMQPIEVMQTLLSPEQFEGFLLGNVIKYRMRARFKGQEVSDHEKAKQYAYWYSLVKVNCLYRINPVEDVPPADWKLWSIAD